ncbi:MAG: glycosyltransferase [Bacteroidota bacterium]
MPTYSFFILPPKFGAGGQGHVGVSMTGQLHLLYQQLKASGLDFEMLVYEDASPNTYYQYNKQIAELGPEIRYRKLGSNLGRASIRNLLAKEAQYQNLLFIDSDSGFPDVFVSNYLPFLDRELDVIIAGGRIYPDKEQLEAAFWLHKKYGDEREQLNLKAVGEARYHGFQTNNFMVSKALMISHPFDESHTGYGHEDTLWGWQLKAMDIPIERIDNPVVHLQLMPASVFLDKQLEAIVNLKMLEIEHPDLPTKLSDFSKQWSWSKPVLKPILMSLCPMARSRLMRKEPGSLYWLDLLKLYAYWK